MAEPDAKLAALYGVPPAYVAPVPPSEQSCECGGCVGRPRPWSLVELMDEVRLRWAPYWPDDWIPWQALLGLLVVAAARLWNRGVR